MLGVVDLDHVEGGGLQHTHRVHVLLHFLADVLGLAETGLALERSAPLHKLLHDGAAGQLRTSSHCADVFLIQPAHALAG